MKLSILLLLLLFNQAYTWNPFSFFSKGADDAAKVGAKEAAEEGAETVAKKSIASKLATAAKYTAAIAAAGAASAAAVIAYKKTQAANEKKALAERCAAMFMQTPPPTTLMMKAAGCVQQAYILDSVSNSTICYHSDDTSVECDEGDEDCVDKQGKKCIPGQETSVKDTAVVCYHSDDTSVECEEGDEDCVDKDGEECIPGGSSSDEDDEEEDEDYDEDDEDYDEDDEDYDEEGDEDEDEDKEKGKASEGTNIPPPAEEATESSVPECLDSTTYEPCSPGDGPNCLNINMEPCGGASDTSATDTSATDSSLTADQETGADYTAPKTYLPQNSGNGAPQYSNGPPQFGPQQSYGGPQQSYGPPQQSYGPQQYGPPQNFGFGAPPQALGAPLGYGTRPPQSNFYGMPTGSNMYGMQGSPVGYGMFGQQQRAPNVYGSPSKPKTRREWYELSLASYKKPYNQGPSLNRYYRRPYRQQYQNPSQREWYDRRPRYNNNYRQQGSRYNYGYNRQYERPRYNNRYYAPPPQRYGYGARPYGGRPSYK